MKISYPHSINHFDAEDYGFVLKYNRTVYSDRPSVYVLLLDNADRIASIKYRQETGRKYPLPGGGVGERESWEQGLIREVKEEIGCVIENVKSIGSFGSYDNSTLKCFQSIICMANLCGEPGKAQSTEDYEQGSQLHWISTNELVDILEKLAGPVNNTTDYRARMTLEIIKNTF